MTERENIKRRGGRLRTSLIDDPIGTRERGRRKLEEKLRELERNPYFNGKPRKPPLIPTDRYDEGLIYAGRSRLLAPNSVRSLAAATRDFRGRYSRTRGERGPLRNADQAADLWQAIELVKVIRRRRGLPERRPRNRELQEVLLLLFGEEVELEAVKQRRRRLRKRLNDVRARRRRRD